MADFNINALSLKDLKQLQKDVAKAISGFEDRKKAEARVALEARARELGFSLSDLAGVEVKATRNPAAAKYQHPENPSVTWSGRGRRPLWFVEAIEAGRKAEDLVVG
ncbi:H-NS histone family protein [Rhodobacter ferrooxidans]|uniref:Histone family protein nucleoid-structuring protein H-NS n=1 Tax=Rhodobacter ferrooxidans TaxID=371731 RepID=C8S3Z2_9RHOB|nr:H-NS histone family protein [Rhodobacter sp. SW2]EEW24254.1 histone family protein nucleoid-structuring protein H-NS [Rhodobacter sp. SW2]